MDTIKNQIVKSAQNWLALTANGPAIKLVGVAERMKAVTTKFSSG
jgi:hypothetical protein